MLQECTLKNMVTEIITFSISCLTFKVYMIFLNCGTDKYFTKQISLNVLIHHTYTHLITIRQLYFSKLLTLLKIEMTTLLLSTNTATLVTMRTTINLLKLTSRMKLNKPQIRILPDSLNVSRK